MKLTPLDIHHKEFRRSLRGYDEKEVDDFLDDVADDFERLFKENIELSEKMESASEQLRRYQVNEQTIQNTMLAAQRSAEDIVNKANADADQVLRDAELKAKEIIHNALQQKQKVAGELTRIKSAEEDFRTRFKAMLETAGRQVNEVTLPEDVDALLNDDGSVEAAPARVLRGTSCRRCRFFRCCRGLRAAARSCAEPEPAPAAVAEEPQPAPGAGGGRARDVVAGGRTRTERCSSGVGEPLGCGRVRSARRGRVAPDRSRGRARRSRRSSACRRSIRSASARSTRTSRRSTSRVARLAVHVTPKASRPGIAGWRDAELRYGCPHHPREERPPPRRARSSQRPCEYRSHESLSCAGRPHATRSSRSRA